MIQACASVARRSFAIGAAAVALALAATAHATGLTWQNKLIEVSTTFQQTDATADFVFRNAGARPVTITSVNASCDCTTAELDKKTYAPGESGRLHVMFEIGDYSGLHDAHVLVTTDTPGERPTDLVLRMAIPEYLVVAPSKAIWHIGSEADAKTIVCAAAKDQTVTITDIRSSDPDVTVRLETIEPGRRYALHLQPVATTRHLAAMIQMQAMIAGVGQRIFHAYAYITGP